MARCRTMHSNAREREGQPSSMSRAHATLQLRCLPALQCTSTPSPRAAAARASGHALLRNGRKCSAEAAMVSGTESSKAACAYLRQRVGCRGQHCRA